MSLKWHWPFAKGYERWRNQTLIFATSLLTNNGDEGQNLSSLHTCKQFTHTLSVAYFAAPSMEGKHTQQCTSTSGRSWRHRSYTEGYPGGLREVHSVYCCCRGVQWRGRQSQVRYDNYQDWGRRYVLHTVCNDVTSEGNPHAFAIAVQTFVAWYNGVS